MPLLVVTCRSKHVVTLNSTHSRVLKDRTPSPSEDGHLHPRSKKDFLNQNREVINLTPPPSDHDYLIMHPFPHPPNSYSIIWQEGGNQELGFNHRSLQLRRPGRVISSLPRTVGNPGICSRRQGKVLQDSDSHFHLWEGTLGVVWFSQYPPHNKVGYVLQNPTAMYLEGTSQL